jgi:hypothetical protein
VGKITFTDAAANLIADCKTNEKRSLVVVTRRVEKHLTPFSEHHRMSDITTDVVRSYIKRRQETDTVLVRKGLTETMPDGTGRKLPDECQPASNAEINRELALLKRMHSPAIRGGTLMYKPSIPMLEENNVRTGFFQPEQPSSRRGDEDPSAQPRRQVVR